MDIHLKIALTALIVLMISKIFADVLYDGKTKAEEFFCIFFIVIFLASVLVEVATLIHVIWS